MPANHLWKFAGRRRDEVAMVDTTGGTIEVIRLGDNGVRKVLLKLDRNGVHVEMALSPKAGADLVDELRDVLAWTAEEASGAL